MRIDIQRLMMTAAAALALLSPATLSASAQDPPTDAKAEKAAPEVIAAGGKLAQKHCARCHAIGLDGDSHHKDAPPFRVIANRYSVWNLAEALAEGISTGHPDMPQFVFEPDDITELLSYMETLETKPIPGPPLKDEPNAP